MTTKRNIMTTQIQALKTKAVEHGDYKMVDICNRALRMDMIAREKCAEVINYAENQE